MFILFAVASFPAACFCSFIAGNSIGTMFPKTNKTVMVTIGAVVAVILAATGWALNLAGVFGIIGASFGPICGSMAADYLLSGRKWAGPRKGINWAGYIAWLVGFIVAILPMVGIPYVVAKEKFSFITPAPVIAFVIGFVLYYVLTKAGYEPPVVEMTAAPAEAAPEPAPAEAKPAPEKAPAEPAPEKAPAEEPKEEKKEEEKKEKSE
jgi:cytosine permease